MIRIYAPSDLEAIVNLFTQTVHLVSSRYYSPGEVEAWAPLQPDMTAWSQFFDARHTIVMDSGDGIIGFGCLSADSGTVDMLFTHHAHQGEGIGSAILEALEKEAVQRGSTGIKLTTSATAWTFYQKRGYLYHHSEKKAYGPVVFDCQVLCKALPVFRDIRRKDRILDNERVLQLLETGEYGFLAMCGLNGYGYGIPISYALTPKPSLRVRQRQSPKGDFYKALENDNSPLGAGGENSGLCIYFHCAPEGFKLDSIRQNNRASFCVVGHTQVLPGQFSTAYESVLVFGRVACDLHEEERYKALDLLVAKYSSDFTDISKKYISKSFHRTNILRLDIEHFSGKSKAVPANRS